MSAITARRAMSRTIAGRGPGLGTNGLTKTASEGKPSALPTPTLTVTPPPASTPPAVQDAPPLVLTTGTASSSRADPAVTALQTMLRNDGYNPGTIDGRWGPNTSGALQRAVSAMGIAAATARYGSSMVARLGTPMATTGGGPPTEEQGGLFDGVSRWLSGLFGGTDQSTAAAAAAGASGIVEDVTGSITDAAARAAAARARQQVTSVISSPAFLIGAGVLGIGAVLWLTAGKKKSAPAAAKAAPAEA